MRRAARLIATTLIVLTTIGQSFAVHAPAWTGGASDAHRVVDPHAAGPAREIAAEVTPTRSMSAPIRLRLAWIAMTASSATALVRPSPGTLVVTRASRSTQSPDGRVDRGRGPPVSC